MPIYYSDTESLAGNSQKPKEESEFSTLELGTMEFMKWRTAKDTNSGNTLIVVKDYLDNKYVILFDKRVFKDIIVYYRQGMPWCMSCDRDDCGHVGFAVYLDENYGINDQVVF